MKIILLMMALLVSSAAIADQWVCKEDISTGIRFDVDTGRHKSIQFNLETYVISASDVLAYKYAVKPIGRESTTAYCKEGVEKNGYLNCDAFGRFRLNTETMRFASSSIGDYLYASKESIESKSKEDDSVISIGTCTKL